MIGREKLLKWLMKLSPPAISSVIAVRRRPIPTRIKAPFWKRRYLRHPPDTTKADNKKTPIPMANCHQWLDSTVLPQLISVGELAMRPMLIRAGPLATVAEPRPQNAMDKMTPAVSQKEEMSPTAG